MVFVLSSSLFGRASESEVVGYDTEGERPHVNPSHEHDFEANRAFFFDDTATVFPYRGAR